MTQDSAHPAAPAAHPAHTKKESLVDALKKGKDWAAVIVLLLSFGQSVYAAYFKPEKDAHEAYRTSKDGLENFSERVGLSVAELKGRLDVVEKLCLDRRGVPVAMVGDSPLSESHKALVSFLNAPEHPAPAPPMTDTDGVEDINGVDFDLRIDLPDAPWENQQVK